MRCKYFFNFYSMRPLQYLSKTELNTCKCQAGYEFDPYIPKGEFFSKGREENSFSEKPLALGGVQLQCVTPKDDSKLSTVEWHHHMLIFHYILRKVVHLMYCSNAHEILH
jgi:hypothetical protein